MERERGSRFEGCEVFEDVGGDDCVCGALWTGIAGLGGTAGFEAAGLAAVAVDVAAVRDVGRVRFTHRGEACEKCLVLVARSALDAVGVVRHGEAALTAPMKGRRCEEDAMILCTKADANVKVEAADRPRYHQFSEKGKAGI